MNEFPRVIRVGEEAVTLVSGEDYVNLIRQQAGDDAAEMAAELAEEAAITIEEAEGRLDSDLLAYEGELDDYACMCRDILDLLCNLKKEAARKRINKKVIIDGLNNIRREIYSRR